MTPVIKEISIPSDFNEIPIPERVANIIRSVNSREWQNLFGFIRLSLASRISSISAAEAVILQGQIKGVEEVNTLFAKILTKKL